MGLKPGYKQTEVGVIPEEWEVAPFDTLVNIIDGDRGINYPSGDDFSDSGHCLFLNAGNVTKERFRFAECAFITRKKDERLGKGKLKRNDIVLTTRGTVGNIAYFDAAVPFEHIRINSGMVILRNESPAFDTEFLYLLLQSHLVQMQIERLSFGSAQPQLTVKGISKFGIVVPGLLEQRAIAEALSDVDALIGALDELIAKKRDLKQATMQQLLTGQKRLPGFSGEWETASFGSVLSKLNAKEHQIQTSEYQSSGVFPVVDQGKELVVGFSDKEDKRFRCPKGGVIVFGDHTCIVKFVDFDFVVGADGTQILAAKVGHCARFHAFQLQLRGIPSTGYNRHFKFLKERTFVAPPLAEQIAIATVLSDMDAEITALEQKRDKTRALKQGMMQELLTGKTRLPVNEGTPMLGVSDKP